MRLLRESLRDIATKGRPQIPGPVTTRPDGQGVAQVFPQSTYDKIFFGGLTAEIWMEPGGPKETLASTQAPIYKNKQSKDKVALLLVPRNVPSIASLHLVYNH